MSDAASNATGTVVGVLGAGQLGRMLALAGYPLANRFVFLDTTGNPSAGIGEVMILDSKDQQRQLEDFLAKVDLVTYEFEHLPVSLVQAIEAHKPVYPSSEAIRVCQNRAEEKALFDRLGIPTPAYRLVESAEELEAVDEGQVRVVGAARGDVAQRIPDGLERQSASGDLGRVAGRREAHLAGGERFRVKRTRTGRRLVDRAVQR